MSDQDENQGDDEPEVVNEYGQTHEEGRLQKVYPTDTLIEAIEEAKGMITIAAELAGCAPKTIYRRADEEEELRRAIDRQRERVDDVAELKLYEAIKSGEAWAIRFRLAKGGGRDYKTRQEHRTTGDDEESKRRMLKERLEGGGGE